MTRVGHLLAAAALAAVTTQASAAVLYSENTPMTFNGSSVDHVGAYGLTGGSATYVVSASTANWTLPSNNGRILFDTTHGSPGPDLYVTSGYCSGNFAVWNVFDGCTNKFSGQLPSDFNDGQLHTYAVVVDAGANDTTLYVDGTLIGTAAYHAPGNDLVLGGEGSNYGWQGTIASVTIYGTALSATEVAGLSGADLPEPGTLALAATGIAALGLIRRRRAGGPSQSVA